MLDLHRVSVTSQSLVEAAEASLFCASEKETRAQAGEARLPAKGDLGGSHERTVQPCFAPSEPLCTSLGSPFAWDEALSVDARIDIDQHKSSPAACSISTKHNSDRNNGFANKLYACVL